MLVTTHNLIANTVYDTVVEKLGIKLNKKGFRYGAVKPDISPLMKHSHTKEGSQDFIANLLNEIQQHPFPETKKELKDLSIKLGVILHYIADYFCYAHNDSRYCDFFPHLLYEFKLARIAHRLDLKKLSSQTWSMCQKEKHVQVSVMEEIDKKHAQYLSTRSKITCDIYFGLEMCVTLIYLVLTKCLAKEAYKAA